MNHRQPLPHIVVGGPRSGQVWKVRPGATFALLDSSAPSADADRPVVTYAVHRAYLLGHLVQCLVHPSVGEDRQAMEAALAAVVFRPEVVGALGPVRR